MAGHGMAYGHVAFTFCRLFAGFAFFVISHDVSGRAFRGKTRDGEAGNGVKSVQA